MIICYAPANYKFPNLIFKNINQLLMVCIQDFCFSVVNYEIPKLKFQITNKFQNSSSK